MADDYNSWRRVWRTPLGLFILIAVVAIAAVTYSHLAFREDIQERRKGFCLSELNQAKKARVLWNGVLSQSEADRDGFVIGPAGQKFPVQFAPPTQEQVAGFKKLVNQTYPLPNCDAP